MLDGGICDLKITTDLAGQETVDLSMPWNGGGLSGVRMHVDRMIRPLAKEAAAL
jgi:hypothetical protein